MTLIDAYKIPTLDDDQVATLSVLFPNPPCVPWCDRQHGLSEFVENMGTLYCRRSFGAPGGSWGVYVEGGLQVVDDRDLASRLEPLDVRLAFGPQLEDVELDQVPAFAAAVAAAARFCATMQAAWS